MKVLSCLVLAFCATLAYGTADADAKSNPKPQLVLNRHGGHNNGLYGSTGYDNDHVSVSVGKPINSLLSKDYGYAAQYGHNAHGLQSHGIHGLNGYGLNLGGYGQHGLGGFGQHGLGGFSQHGLVGLGQHGLGGIRNHGGLIGGYTQGLTGHRFGGLGQQHNLGLHGLGLGHHGLGGYNQHSLGGHLGGFNSLGGYNSLGGLSQIGGIRGHGLQSPIYNGLSHTGLRHQSHHHVSPIGYSGDDAHHGLTSHGGIHRTGLKGIHGAHSVHHGTHSVHHGHGHPSTTVHHSVHKTVPVVHHKSVEYKSHHPTAAFKHKEHKGFATKHTEYKAEPEY